VRLRNMHHVPSMNKNLVNGSLLCKNAFKLVFELNNYIVLKFGSFVGKGYDCDGLFRLTLLDSYNKVVNHVCNGDESNIWHSRLCHVNSVVCCGLLVGVQFQNSLWSRILSVKYMCNLSNCASLTRLQRREIWHH
jgi:hypothetical protein